MDAYEYLDPFRDAVEAMEALRDAGRMPPVGSPFWRELIEHTERARALWDTGPTLATVDAVTGERRHAIQTMLPALFTDIEGAAV